MKENQKLALPNKLETFRFHIEKTIKPFIKITAEVKPTTLFDSKFGGNPYLPVTMKHPKSKKGKPLKLLAQLNFEQIPHIEDMPTKGILQFYIDAEDDLYGSNFGNENMSSDFKIVYHREIIQDESLLITDFSYINELKFSDFPVENEFGLRFEIDHGALPFGDYRFGWNGNSEIETNLKGIREDEDLCELYSETISSEGHKIGGYPYFTQTDPREYSEKLQEHNVLLFQMDSDYKINIMWGDCGVANFFIRREDLLNFDFSNVLYNWDCC